MKYAEDDALNTDHAFGRAEVAPSVSAAFLRVVGGVAPLVGEEAQEGRCGHKAGA